MRGSTETLGGGGRGEGGGGREGCISALGGCISTCDVLSRGFWSVLHDSLHQCLYTCIPYRSAM